MRTTTRLPPACPERVPVAVLDQRTLQSLARLGDASPVADAEPLYAGDMTGTAPAVESPLLRKARARV